MKIYGTAVKSARKAFVTGVKAVDARGEQISVTWSNAISDVGNIKHPTGLLGVVDSVNLHVRRNDGAVFGEMSLHISHSFSNGDVVLQFDPYQGRSQ